MDDAKTNLVRFVKEKALKHGKFKLASGSESNYYIDAKLITSDPKGLRLVTESIEPLIRSYAPDAVGGLELGCIYIATAISLRSLDWERPIPQFTVRKKAKEHGQRKLVEGIIPPHGRVVVVDDVVTTGGSIVQAINAVRDDGCQVVAAFTIVDRDGGAREALERLDVPYHPLVEIADLGVENSSNEHQRACATSH